MKSVVRKFEERIIKTLGVRCWPLAVSELEIFSVSYRGKQTLRMLSPAAAPDPTRSLDEIFSTTRERHIGINHANHENSCLRSIRKSGCPHCTRRNPSIPLMCCLR